MPLRTARHQKNNVVVGIADGERDGGREGGEKSKIDEKSTK